MTERVKETLRRTRAGLGGWLRELRGIPFLLPAVGVVCAALLALFIIWSVKNPGISGAERGMAVLSVLLFAVVCLRFLRRWFTEWAERPGTPEELRPVGVSGAWETVGVFFTLLLFEAAVLLFVFLLQMAMRGATSFRDSLSFWTGTDSQHYLAIAEDWYLDDAIIDRRVQLVFLPGYPLVIRLFYPIFGNYLYAGLFASALCFAGAGTMLYELALLDMDRVTARRALRFACLLPGAFFYASPMGESLFLLLSVSCVFLMRKRKWLPACLLGGCAAFTRSLGLMLAVPVGYELLTETIRCGAPRGTGRRVGQFACLLLIPAGFAAYCLICRQVSGNAFQWAIYQREHWHQQLGLFFNTAAYQTREAVSSCQNGQMELFFGLWLPNLVCSIAALCLMAVGCARLRTSCSAYFIAYYAVAIGATWLLSAPRYLLVLFPLPLVLARLTENRRADGLCTVAVTAAGLLYTLAFVARWQVW